MPDAARYARLRAAGLCPNCRAPVSGYAFCVACRQKIARAQQGGQGQAQRRVRLRDAGRCIACGRRTPDVRGQVPRCAACRVVFASLRRAVRTERRRLGLCVECGRELANGHYRGLGPHCSDRHTRSLARQKARTA